MSKFTNSPSTSFKGLVAGCIVKLLLASVIALIFQVSFMSVATGVGTKEIGYRVLYRADNAENYEEVYLHLYADGEDQKLAQYQNDPHYYKVAERSVLDEGVKTGVNVAACLFGLAMLCASVYSALWRAGDALACRAELANSSFNRLFGLKVGLAAAIPVALLYVLVPLCKLAGALSQALTVFKLVNYYCFAYCDLFITKVDGALTVSGLGIFGLLPVVLVLPAVCALAYRMGQRHFILKNALMYTKNNESKGE